MSLDRRRYLEETCNTWNRTQDLWGSSAYHCTNMPPMFHFTVLVYFIKTTGFLVPKIKVSTDDNQSVNKSHLQSSSNKSHGHVHFLSTLKGNAPWRSLIRSVIIDMELIYTSFPVARLLPYALTLSSSAVTFLPSNFFFTPSFLSCTLNLFLQSDSCFC